MTLTFKLDLDRVQINQPVKYLGQRPFSSEGITGHSNTHTGPIARPGPLKWSIIICKKA